MSRQRTAVIGGGAAGFFMAINLKELCPQMEVTILEASTRVLRKVEISGGGRCNVTNSFEDVTPDLQSVYPRGHRLLKRLFNVFDHRDAYAWFQQHGVALTTQPDHCVFPRSQDSHTIINMFLAEARRLGIRVQTGVKVNALSDVTHAYDFVCVTTGGQPRAEGLQWLEQPIVPPVPSLFTFSIADERLRALMGTVAEQATAFIPGMKMRAQGPLLVTHWGMSGPCILRLSSYAARWLNEAGYQAPLSVNWASCTEAEARQALAGIVREHPQKQIASVPPLGLPQRLWGYLIEKSLASGRAVCQWNSLSQKEVHRLVNMLINDTYQMVARAPFKDEFVTCGGVALTAVHPQTLESRTHPRLFFAGEVLDIDGVTGGFNFQAAWTTAYVVAQAISSQAVQ